MNFVTIRSERTVGDIADTLYVRLTARQRAKTEAAILAANPQLSEAGSLREGAVLRVPELPELRAKVNPKLEQPVAQIADNLAATLSTFSKRLAERVKLERETSKTQSELLRSDSFRKEITDAPNLQALAEEAGKALGTRNETLRARQKQTEEAIDQALKELKASRT